jgi:CRP-like cAMP-binding protein/tetratricopeptide (TPR) repeat protein
VTDGLGSEPAPGQAGEVRIVAGNVRWERPTTRTFWSSLADPERRALAASGVEEVFRAGSALLREGEQSSQVMIIKSGWAKVSVSAGSGEQIIAMRGPGDVVGERAALLAGVRSASVTALDEVRAMVVPAERFAEFLLGHPRASDVLEHQVRERREEDGNARLLPGEAAGGERRLAWLLFELAQRRGGDQAADKTGVFTLPVSQQEVADWAGASPDAVARLLRSWRERGIVRTDRRQLTVVNLDALAAICGAGPADSAGHAGQTGQRRRDVAAPSAAFPAGSALRSSPNCSVFVTDVAGYGHPGRNDADRLAVRRALYAMLRSAFEESGVPWAECYHEDRGDGAVIVVPPTIATARVVDPLVAVLAAKLRAYNRHASDVVRIQLRAALHVGPVGRDEEGLTGEALIHAARILDAPVIKERLAVARADLVFAASGYVYEHVIRHGIGQVDPAAFQRVTDQVKESHITAWILLAGPAAGGTAEPGPGARRLGPPGPGALPVAPLGLLPAEVRGRDELLAELRRPLSRLPRRSGRAWVIAGMGGLGKSTVALAVARAAKARGWRVWWVAAGDAASLTGGMLEVLRELGAPESVTVPVREGAPTAPGRAWEFLNGMHPAGRRWLLVFDGADSPGVLAAAGSATPADGTGWLRPDPAGMVIVTTRNRDARVWGTAVSLRELRPLDDQAAADVLHDMAPGVPDSGDRQARDLARRLGGLPLALHLAGAYLASPFARWASFEDYRKALDSVEFPEALGEVDEPGANARATIQRTWDLSLDALAVDGRPQARPLLHVLSCYAPATPIPAWLLRPLPLAALAGGAGGAAGRAPVSSDREQSRRLREGLHGLSSTGLIDNAEGGPGDANAVTVHPVVADVNRSRLPAMDRAERTAVCDAVVALLQAGTAGLDSERPADWPHWTLLFPHVNAVLELAPVLDGTVLSRLLLIGAAATEALLRSGRLAAAEKLAWAGAEAAAFAAADDPARLTARGSLAQALDRRGRNSDAERLYRELLADKRRVLGEDAPDTLATRHDLARAIGLQGRYAEAEELYGGLLADQRRVLGNDHPDTLATRHDLTRMMGRQGRNAEAERLCRAVLAARRRVLGDEHPDTLATRHSLARMAGMQGRYREAEELYRLVLADRRRVLGEEHPDTLATRHRLARMIGLQGRYGEAEELCRQVLADRRRVLGAEHPDNLATWHRLARMVGLQGRYAEAERLFRQVLADRSRVLGEEHPDTLATGHRLAWLIGRQGRYREAVELVGQVLGGRRQVLGDDHPDTLAACDTLAWLTGLQDRHGEAEELCRHVLADRSRVLGDEHPDTLASRAMIAWLEGLQGRYTEAAELYRRVLADRIRVLGDNHPDTVATAGELAQVTTGRADREPG